MARLCVRGMVVLALLVVPALAWAAKPPDLNARVAALEAAVAALQATATAQQARIAELEGTVAALQGTVQALQNSPAMGLNPFLEVTLDAELGLPLIRFKAVNVQIVNDAGPLDAHGSPGQPGTPLNPISNGTGNLILGYNEPADDIGAGPSERNGSHNLVVGPYHWYSSYAGIVAGFQNKAMGIYATVTGGTENEARGAASSISGGQISSAIGEISSISGGFGGLAEGITSSISGGNHNRAVGQSSSVSGGDGVTVYDANSWAAGGYQWPPDPTP